MATLDGGIRTSLGDVEDELAPGGTTLEDGQIHLHMNTAHHIVDEHLEGNSDITDAQREDVERLLAAHFVLLSDRRVDEQNVLDDRRVYQGETGMNLEATLKGQAAMAVDRTGTLRQLNKSDTQKLEFSEISEVSI